MLRPVGSHVSCNNNPGSIFPRVLFDRFLKNGSVFPQRHYIYIYIQLYTYYIYIYVVYVCVYIVHVYIYIYLHTLPQESISRLPYFCVFCNNIVPIFPATPQWLRGDWLICSHGMCEATLYDRVVVHVCYQKLGANGHHVSVVSDVSNLQVLYTSRW